MNCWIHEHPSNGSLPFASGRHLLLIRSARETLHRFRCNSFGDALSGLFLARRLMTARRRGPDL